jgi:hypothetical protein
MSSQRCGYRSEPPCCYLRGPAGADYSAKRGERRLTCGRASDREWGFEDCYIDANVVNDAPTVSFRWMT